MGFRRVSFRLILLGFVFLWDFGGADNILGGFWGISMSFERL